MSLFLSNNRIKRIDSICDFKHLFNCLNQYSLYGGGGHYKKVILLLAVIKVFDVVVGYVFLLLPIP